MCTSDECDCLCGHRKWPVMPWRSYGKSTQRKALESLRWPCKVEQRLICWNVDGVRRPTVHTTRLVRRSTCQLGKQLRSWLTVIAYPQVQTRSADEPMTTFAYCNECGNRWKVRESVHFLGDGIYIEGWLHGCIELIPSDVSVWKMNIDPTDIADSFIPFWYFCLPPSTVVHWTTLTSEFLLLKCIC